MSVKMQLHVIEILSIFQIFQDICIQRYQGSLKLAWHFVMAFLLKDILYTLQWIVTEPPSQALKIFPLIHL